MLEHLLADIAETGDLSLYGIVADWLDDNDRPREAELIRLTWVNRRPDTEPRLLQLLREGVQPCVPRFTNSFGMEFVWIPPGKFEMGTPGHADNRSHDEHPHPVELTRGYWFGVTPVTQRQYRAIVGDNPSAFRAGGHQSETIEGIDTEEFPVESVVWPQGTDFCKKLAGTEKETTKRKYRLPTEAEWEYACRAGAPTFQEFHIGKELSARGANISCYDDDREELPLGRPCPVRQYPPNAWGLYDMHGNVDEWCFDWYESDYRKLPTVDPSGPEEGITRIVRGGNYSDSADVCRSASRFMMEPDDVWDDTGFRVVCEIAH